MKKNNNAIRCTALALALTGTVVVSNAVAQEKAQKLDPKMEEMMKKAEAASMPGQAHKVLDPLVGDWDAEVKMWMTPDAPPTVNKATAKSNWILKNRFVQLEFNGEFMGKPFRGLSFSGYDNIRQKYSNVWIDDMNTTVVNSEGDADAAGKVLTFGGTYSCPITGEKHKETKQIVRIISPDKHVFEMHDPTRGANSKTMEITYTRKASRQTAGR